MSFLFYILVFIKYKQNNINTKIFKQIYLIMSKMKIMKLFIIIFNNNGKYGKYYK